MGAALSGRELHNRNLVDLGPLYPQGIHASKEESYHYPIVKKFIRDGRLAPFYRGITDGDSNSITISRSYDPSIHANLRRYQLLYSDTIECPICLLHYPKYINYSRCCFKPICTECFLQIRSSSRTTNITTSCPYCVQTSFGVLHIPPTWSTNYPSFSKRRQDLIDLNIYNQDSTVIPHSRRHRPLLCSDIDVVFTDQVRPHWMETVESGQVVNRSTTNIGTTRRTIVRPIQIERRSSRSNSLNEGRVGSVANGYPLAEWDLEESFVLDTIRHSHILSRAS
ncbi:hypothetical protein BDB01DRAFT_775899 [Pilobolus umbonatus]|nr:hypothetical protein BDB01DRAFT_775899 [Pilobolus umbonatus]